LHYYLVEKVYVKTKVKVIKGVCMKSIVFLLALFVFLVASFGTTYAQIDTIKALVIFVKFKNDTYDNDATIYWPSSLDDTLPAWADSVIDSNETSIRNGTITHFYKEMSYGATRVYGMYYDTLFMTDSSWAYYCTPAWRYGETNKMVLESLDAKIDYSRFDNNGDGQVDMVFINYRLFPIDSGQFLYHYPWATGLSSLGTSYITNDGVTVSRGTTQYVMDRGIAVGVMAHEMGHKYYYIDDLYDADTYDDFSDADQSSGSGYCQMGGGNFGEDSLRPAAFNVYSRIKAGFISGSDITSISGWKKNIELNYLGDATCGKGNVVKLPISGNEYFLAANVRKNGYYDHFMPKSGLLIYHVDDACDQYGLWNARELHKMVDMECADGLWKDKGWDATDHPDTVNTINGRDNLDFFTKDSAACVNYHGNQGDSTDFWDGITYKNFSDATNPSACKYDSVNDTTWYNSSSSCYNQSTPSHVAVLNIRKKLGADSIMIADFYTNNWTGHISRNTTWSDSVHISGDIIVDAGCTLTINPGCLVEIEPDFDDQDTGSATKKIEFSVLGMLKAEGTPSDTIVFTPSSATDTVGCWYGIKVYGKVSLKNCRVEYANYPVRQVYATGSASTIDSCYIYNFQTYGVEVQYGLLNLKNSRIRSDNKKATRGISIGNYISEANVENNILQDFKSANTIYGMMIGSCTNGSSKIKIKNNTITDLDSTGTRYGIYVVADTVLLSGNTVANVSGTNAYGIYLWYSEYDTIRGNRVKNGEGKFAKGIYMSTSHYSVLEQDTIGNCSSRGMDVYNSSTVDIKDNILIDNDTSCYVLYVTGSSSNPDIIGNVLRADTSRANGWLGIGTATNATTKVRNNRVEDFTGIGLATGANGSSMDCGTATDWGLNSVYWNLDNKGSRIGYYLVENDSTDSTNARYNYFGPSPVAGNFEPPVRWSPYLTTDPNAYFYTRFSSASDTIFWKKTNGGIFAIESGEYSDSATGSKQWALIDSLKIKDVVLEIQVQNKRFCQGTKRGANVGVRFKDTSNYVAAYYDSSVNRIFLEVDSSSVAKKMDSASVTLNTSYKDTLRIVAYKNDYQVWRNKTAILSAVRTTSYLSDRVGVMTAYSASNPRSHSHFDDVEVYPCFFFENFKDTATAWRKVSGNWRRESEQYSDSGSVGNDTSIVYVDSTYHYNYVLESDVWVKSDTGFLLLRYRNPKNNVQLTLSKNNSLRLGLRQGGVWSEKGVYTMTLDTARHNLKVKATGNDYDVYLDGTKVISAMFVSDSLGYRSALKARGHVHFDNVLVTKHITYNKGVLGKGAAQPGAPEIVFVKPLPIPEMLANHPNPFAIATQILFSVPCLPGKERVHTRLLVFDVDGNLVTSLVDDNRMPGMYGITWDGLDSWKRAVSPGVYFYRLEAGDKVKTEKMMLTR
jgi:hypothetical protein